MNPLRALFDAITDRTTNTDPGPALGLVVTPGRFGARTVRDPHIADYAQARLRRLVRDGLDPADRALVDPATAATGHSRPNDRRGHRRAAGRRGHHWARGRRHVAGRVMDLEIWLIGTPGEVTAAMTAIRNIGTVLGASVPQPLFGADSGRVRRYLHVHLRATAAAAPPKVAHDPSSPSSQSPLTY